MIIDLMLCIFTGAWAKPVEIWNLNNLDVIQIYAPNDRPQLQTLTNPD
jgi:hypothetical protein